jgi:hypothetical protein
MWTDAETKVTITCKCYRQAMQVTCPNAELWMTGPMSARSSGAPNAVITVMSWKREHKKKWKLSLRLKSEVMRTVSSCTQASALPCGVSLIPEDRSRLMDTGESRGSGMAADPRVKDIDAAEKKVRKTGPFNPWKETAWHLWRKGEM